jgi:hypothetical protein
MLNETPKLSLYTEAIYRGSARDNAPLPSARVSIVGRFAGNNGEWLYNVCENKTSPVYVCGEAELEPAEPIPLVSDEEIVNDIVLQTAQLRHSNTSRGLRELLASRGIDPMKCLQIACDQGDDVNVTLILSDGTIVNADYREHPETRQAWKISDWQIRSYTDREIEICREIVLSNDQHEFDASVKRCYDTEVAATDHPLPPLKWGDRMWHALEPPPK